MNVVVIVGILFISIGSLSVYSLFNRYHCAYFGDDEIYNRDFFFGNFGGKNKKKLKRPVVFLCPIIMIIPTAGEYYVSSNKEYTECGIVSRKLYSFLAILDA